jgi:hypothetical protein
VITVAAQHVLRKGPFVEHAPRVGLKCFALDQLEQRTVF